MANQNIRIMTYVNPFLAKLDGVSGDPFTNNYFEDAKSTGCLIKTTNQDDASETAEVLTLTSVTPEFIFGK